MSRFGSALTAARKAFRPESVQSTVIDAADRSEYGPLAKRYADPIPIEPAKLAAATAALEEFIPKAEDSAKAYMERHLDRLAMTLAMVPPPGRTSRILELGSYMQLTPYFKRFSGYREVRGAYFGTMGKTERKAVAFPDGYFTCTIDKFDAEKDRFPYPDNQFDTVVVAEVIEHLLFDPMHMLLECRRVLADEGVLIVTTPNIGSVSAAARAMEGLDNPQNWSKYALPQPYEVPEVGHMREYTANEVGRSFAAAGFDVTALFTAFDPTYNSHLPLLPVLEANAYSAKLRGQQTYCSGVKNLLRPIERYPYFLYE